MLSQKFSPLVFFPLKERGKPKAEARLQEASAIASVTLNSLLTTTSVRKQQLLRVWQEPDVLLHQITRHKAPKASQFPPFYFPCRFKKSKA
jgi:hypothetical protein